MGFNAVVAAAPLIKANTKPFPYGVAVAIGEVMVFFGQGEEYAPTKEEKFEEKFEDSTCNEGSLTRCLRIKRRCKLYGNRTFGHDDHTGLCLGGVTASLAKEFFDLYGDTFQGFMATEGKKIVPPILLQQSGDPAGTDGLVFNPQQTDFCRKSCKRCTITNYKESKHHIFSEVDSIYKPFLVEADQFMQTHRNMVLPQEPLPEHIKEEGEGCNDDLDCHSRYCDAHFAFDVFGGTCQNSTFAISHALSWSLHSSFALVAAAIAIGFLFAQ